MDHVVPKCLFIPPVPLDMVTVPACRNCNQAKSANDDYFRDMLIADMFCSSHPVAQALLTGKMRRSIQTNRSFVARETIRQQRMEPLFSAGGVYLGDVHAVRLDSVRVRDIYATIVRGLYYKVVKKRFPEGYAFEFKRYYPTEADQLFSKMKAVGANGPYRLGDVFAFTIMYAQEDNGITSCLLQFFGGMHIWVTTKPETID
jgi:hypothetical protein